MKPLGAIAVGVSCAALSAGIVGWAKPGGTPPTLPKPPIAWFSDHCARCHGEGGSFYGPTFGKGLSDSDLAAKVKDMTEGPGGEALHGIDLAALVAYHRSLVAKHGFVCLTSIVGRKVNAETSPDVKTVTVRFEGKTLHFRAKGGRLNFMVPRGVNKMAFTLTIDHDKVSLSYPKDCFTNSAQTSHR